MKLSYDQAKNDRNEQERGFSFERFMDLDFESAKFWQNDR
jgi:uncharacterized DUF497 family protein